ncbi:hypothetical protein CRG98_005119 [Punica granatum]|uniref:Protein SLOW GREEN 1, chloroplastic n=1 Tax=Punica granatum TaxID=22663 RepID=A0A2I0L1B7_PUNGR|nr:hypothetical protein CRG98_005119 [Punica granatum]
MSLINAITAAAGATTATVTSRSRSRSTSSRAPTLLLLLPAGLTRFRCSNSTPRRGFGARSRKTSKVPEDENEPPPPIPPALQKRKSPLKQSGPLPTQAPGLSSQYSGNYGTTTGDLEFEERLKAVRRSAVEQKKADEMKEFGVIDYDAPTDTEGKTIGVGTKIGIGVAVVVFGLVFALGDYLPSVSDSPSEKVPVSRKDLPEGEKAILQSRLKQFEAALVASPKDPTALEGAAVTLAELGEYTKAASRLENLIEKKPNDPDVYRVLGEVRTELQDYEGSVAAYKKSSALSKEVNFEVLRGLTDALLAAKRPDERDAEWFIVCMRNLKSIEYDFCLGYRQAVQVILASRDLLSSKQSGGVKAGNNMSGTEKQMLDPVQIDLLLGKAYSEWGHVSDAVSVYDRLISSHPDDFRGYLAKGIILKENGNAGDAERMFIQARFFAPEKAKALVDRYSRR